ncbi:putative ribosomal RNA small subunit methyltransferase A [Clarias magur]|uniref:Putative ribosomal RNA small subunit methyltransferase A n=1 Tax=Clarias magur TaxID=1594786 RepID=A0A8J4UDY5_CLAMG|nr:putative ribosomal RNA small subunit methyltransferase A [Clarias magur]
MTESSSSCSLWRGLRSRFQASRFRGEFSLTAAHKAADPPGFLEKIERSYCRHREKKTPACIRRCEDTAGFQ